ncbi:MAG: [FeFe] hydrogenase H-cluster maturation GTPase HydF [Lachnospiraceae bacterium]|nr:[FeFe] hydrogenase H-cluster maturation GTPase HydF [Lachnospiraceae bacterium]
MAGLNETANADRLHIGFFGCRNAGKSSVVNAVTNQEIAVVSDVKGTTTDPVQKAMELLPLGPVVIIDTPGFDDDDKLLGEKRVERAKKILNKSDIAVLVVSAVDDINNYDKELIEIFKNKNIPYIVVFNKCDLIDENKKKTLKDSANNILNSNNILFVSAVKKDGIEDLKNLLGTLKPKDSDKSLLDGIANKNDFIVLVTPIDESAPKGRMILPQVQMIRDVLNHDAYAIVTKETELKTVLENAGKKPNFIITDSQVFKFVDSIVPSDIPLTSFSILLARYKGFLSTAVKGVKAVDSLKTGDKVLIAEGCTHHRQCYDIGTYKIPKWLKEKTGADLILETSSGTEFPEDLSKYKMVIHCGGCMTPDREMLYRMKCANDAKIPFTNYGIFIAYVNGILERSIKNVPFND